LAKCLDLRCDESVDPGGVIFVSALALCSVGVHAERWKRSV
jgi:hypothetical protein